MGKTKCALCNLYFKSDSVKGTTCNKHVSAFRSLRGARVVGRRFDSSSRSSPSSATGAEGRRPPARE